MNPELLNHFPSKHKNVEERIAAGNSDELDEAMYRFGIAYADQTEKDYKALVAAAKKGRIKVAGE